ncbi:ankyrin repeat-containing protein [Legionella busanensis]|uniref:Ankyrin repeat-containing protein n=1 Tax=Legionella busanensis TaxID=190655 RepID=A0A378JMC6_9GAMM|nr:ankyrin repeat domain-containing protein [Legionella busanensis]STX51349.1 ankyrin repeat-containing protein [Legionella busanensis]
MLYVLLFIILIGFLIKYKTIMQGSFTTIIKGFTSVDDTKSKISSGLKHHDLLQLMERFNYKPGEGICFGFTITWAQESVSHRESIFYERINLIRREKENLVAKIRRITNKIKRNQQVNYQENQLLEINALIEAVCIAQSPDSYEHLYNGRITQTNIENILNIAQQSLGCGGVIKKLLTKTVAMTSVNQVDNYFKYVSSLIHPYDNVAMVVSNEQHSIGLKRHPYGWLLLDTNYLYKQSSDYPYLLLNDRQLSRQLNDSFEEQGTLIINIDFIALGNLNLKQRLQQLNSSYPVTYQHFRYKNCRNFSFIEICVQSGDDQSIREMVHLHNKRGNLLIQTQVKDSLRLAVDCNQSKILAILMEIQDLDINIACQSDGKTALGLACRFGNLCLVKLLLTHPRIDINHLSDKGDTPLMIACKYSKQSMELITLLLQAGANITIQNYDRKTALSIARENNNKTAIAAIRDFNRSQRLLVASDNSSLAFLERRYSLSHTTSYGRTFFTTKRAMSSSKNMQPETSLLSIRDM